jgi:general secretion pathway protein G
MAELLVVLLIVGLLAALAVPNVTGAIQRAREAALRENLHVMRGALDDYFADTASYPNSLDDLVEGRYLRFVPEDPVAGEDAGWEVETGPSGGIRDVRSTSDDRASDETVYSEW